MADDALGVAQAVVPVLRGLAGPEGSGSLAPVSAAATGSISPPSGRR